MDLSAIDRALVADLYLSRQGHAVLAELVERFGPRFGGSDQERGAAAFLAEYLGGLGLQAAHSEAFATIGWERAPARLLADGAELPCVALSLCPPGEASGELVYLGDGAPAEYAAHADRIRGNIVMVSTATPAGYPRGMHRVEKLGRAAALGAAGFIWLRADPGLLVETGSARFGVACEIPAIAVAWEVGQRLLRRAPRGVTIQGAHRLAAVQSYNAVAELAGTTDELILVGAHYDGHDLGDAATDDGCGTAVLLEAARALSQYAPPLRRTVRFVAFAQEEQGFLGAAAYVRRHAAELGRHRFMLNLDVAGRPGVTGFQLQGWPELQPWFRALWRELGEAVVVSDGIDAYSDHFPFALAGIPSAHLASGDPRQVGRGWAHTAADTLDKVDPRAIQADAVKVARAVVRLATVEELPLQPRTQAEMRHLLAAQGIDQVLALEGRPLD